MPFDLSFFYSAPAAFLGRYCRQKLPNLDLLALILFIIVIMITTKPDPCFYGCASSKNSSISKEAASMISGGYSAFLQSHKPSSTTSATDIIPFLNYVKIDTSSEFNNRYPPVNENPWEAFRNRIQTLQGFHSANHTQPGENLQKCSEQLPCIQMHNGGIIQYEKGRTFGGTGATNAIFFNVDPDANGPNGRVSFYLYTTGRLTTGEQKSPNTKTSGGSMTSQDIDPDYIQSLH